MKTLKVIIQSALLLFFYTIIYSVLSFFLDQIFYVIDGIPTSKYDHTIIEYMIYFFFFYGIFFLLFFFMYRQFMIEEDISLLARILIGVISGFIIGMIMMRLNVSFYIGGYRPLKAVILFTISGASISLIDFYLFKKNISSDAEN